MYWQVYLHKTVVVADQMLVKLLKRTRELSMNETELFATPSLTISKNKITSTDLKLKN